MRGGISFIITALLARSLQPFEYGRYTFLIASFLTLRQLIDLSSSSAFFTFISQKARSRFFYKTYAIWICIQFFIPIILIGILIPKSIIYQILFERDRILLLLAFVSSFFQNSIWTFFSNLAESNRQSIISQKVYLSITFIHLIGIIIMIYYSVLNLEFIFSFVIIEWAIAAILICRNLKRNYIFDNTENLNFVQILNMFIIYCRPYIFLVLFTFISQLFERWILHYNGGSDQQAYFSIASQYGGIILLVTTSILQILWKEFAQAAHEKNLIKIHDLYSRSTRLAFFFGVVSFGAILPWVDDLIELLLGKSYLPGKMSIMIMLFYPIHQSIGQILGTLFMATERNKQYVIVQIVYCIFGIGLTYFLVGSSHMILLTLNLGAVGMAIKMVILQFATVTTLQYIIAKINNWKFEFLYQIVFFCLAIFLAYCIKLILNFFTQNFYIAFPIFLLSYGGLWIQILRTNKLNVGLNINEINIFR
jgi:O-antigen/teichoic acid export membrane protein